MKICTVLKTCEELARLVEEHDQNPRNHKDCLIKLKTIIRHFDEALLKDCPACRPDPMM